MRVTLPWLAVIGIFGRQPLFSRIPIAIPGDSRLLHRMHRSVASEVEVSLFVLNDGLERWRMLGSAYWWSWVVNNGPNFLVDWLVKFCTSRLEVNGRLVMLHNGWYYLGGQGGSLVFAQLKPARPCVWFVSHRLPLSNANPLAINPDNIWPK